MLRHLTGLSSILTLLAFALLARPAHAVPPAVIGFQGVLTDSAGAPQVGTFTATFSLYGVSLGGSPLWTETQSLTTDTQGRFSVALGETTPLDHSYFGVGERYLGITIEADPEMTPREELVSVPYSLKTKSLDGSSGGQVQGDIDLTGELEALGMSSKIRFHYNSLIDLPDPTTFHGAIAHVHDSGYLYFAHAGQWVPLANQSELSGISVLSAPDGSPDSVVVVDSVGDVRLWGGLNGALGPIAIGANGLVINGQLVVNGAPVNFNALMNINNGAQVVGGDLNILGPRILAIMGGGAARVKNLAELELEPGARMVARTTSEVRVDAGVVWTSSAPLRTEAEIEIATPGFLRIMDSSSSDMSTLELDNLEIGKGARLMVLTPEDLTITGGQFDFSAPKFVFDAPVPIEMVALSLTGAPGLSVSGAGGVSVTGGGGLTTGPGSPLQVNGPSTFAQPINAPLQVGVGAPGAGALHVVGNITATGAKLFVQDHPGDPSKEIRYIALEGGEAGTYTRGTAVLKDGAAVIDFPEHFKLVTGEDGLTAQVTPRGPVQSMLYVESVSPCRLVVKSSHPKDGGVSFDYLVNGLRSGFENHKPIVDKERLASR